MNILKNNAIAIPIYKEKLNDTEIISLKRINSCFKNEKIFFIAPENLKFDFSRWLSNYLDLG